MLKSTRLPTTRTLPTLLTCASLPLLGLSPLLAQENETETRGFSADSVYAAGDVDTVDLFGGGLSVTLPIGGEYPVGGGLSYGLTLVYNGKLWDYHTVFLGIDGTGQPIHETLGFPNVTSEAGFGWSLNLGFLIPPDAAAPGDFYLDKNNWRYVSPDGAQHYFYDQLHEGEADGSATTWYTRDNSYLRLTQVSAGLYEVEFPNGEIHSFGYLDTSGTQDRWRLTQVDDPFGNWYAVERTNVLEWKITDSHNREHFITRSFSLATGDYAVTEVDLAAFNSTRAVYTFTYATETIPQGCEATGGGPSHTVRLLTEVALPDGTKYEMKNGDGSARYATASSCGTSEPDSGAIEGLRLRTRGQVEWEYGTWMTPQTNDRPGSPHSPVRPTRGVVERRTLGGNGTLIGTWYYTRELHPAAPWSTGNKPTELRTHAEQPTGDCTVHYFDANPGYVSVEDTNPSPGWSYGLPFSWENTRGGGTYLSTEVFDGHTAGHLCSGTLVRSAAVVYDHDTLPPLLASWHGRAFQVWHDTNRRLTKQRTFYHDDGNKYSQVAYTGFDGLGHYRTATTAGNFSAGNARTTTTNYNSGVGTYPGSFTPPATSAPWVLGTFADRSVTEGGVTYKEQFCFDAATGFLERRRTQADSTRQAKDTIAVYVAHSTGDVQYERYFGGDGQAVNTGSNLCTLTLPPSNIYEIQHNYTNAYGSRRWSRYNKPTGAGIGFKFLDQDIDLNTGLPSASRDTAGLATTYSYDALGRLTLVEPAAGHGAQTAYAYTNATPTANAAVYIDRLPNAGGAAIQETSVVFDSLGRVGREWQRLPVSPETWAYRETDYNARGWKSGVTEWILQGTGKKWTYFTDYDPFGRPGTVTPPDGAAHAVTFAYDGVRKVSRTVAVAMAAGETPQTTVEEYDRQGRLSQVTEPTGTVTTYGYDPANRLASVSMTDGLTTQNRAFSYDGRGFLLSETHPEKTSAVTYSGYDARGHATTKVDGSSDLTFTYDRAERLTQVEETGTGGRVLKAFEYATANNGADLRQGKLWKATRHNYLPAFGGLDVEIEEVYAYAGKDGRASSRNTNRDGSLWFSQTFAWDELGNPASVGYPACHRTGCGSIGGRTVTYGYTQGSLTSVPGYASSISYHPNLMLSQIAHSNGVTDTWAIATNKMRRPLQISTSGVSGAANFNTGTFAYDGAGNISAMGGDTFTYDGLSRLLSGTAQGGTFSETNTYDPFGNRVSATMNGVSRSTAADPATNRLTGSASRPVSYDAAGNQTQWGTATTTYDELHMPVRLVDGAEDLSYIYTADDERLSIVEASPVSAQWMVRDLSGQILRSFEELNTGGFTFYWDKDYIRGDGRMLARASGAGLQHATVDHLGSPRLWTNSSAGVAARYDYLPFGELTEQSLETEPLKYTGHERDDHLSGGCGSGTTQVNGQLLDDGETKTGCDAVTSENTTVAGTLEVKFIAGERIELGDDFIVATGATFTAIVDGDLKGARQDLDYMHARYCSPYLGRFTSTDPVVVRRSSETPQRYNRYSYARNNPLKYVDPDGKDVFLVSRPVSIFRAARHAFVLVRPTGVNTQVMAPRVDKETGLLSLAGTQSLNRGETVLGKSENNTLDLRSLGQDDTRIFRVQPSNQSREQFEQNVVEAFDSYDNSLNYNNMDSMGRKNSNALASGILMSAGASQEEIEAIADQLDGFNFGLTDPVELEDVTVDDVGSNNEDDLNR